MDFYSTTQIISKKITDIFLFLILKESSGGNLGVDRGR